MYVNQHEMSRKINIFPESLHNKRQKKKNVEQQVFER